MGDKVPDLRDAIYIGRDGIPYRIVGGARAGSGGTRGGAGGDAGAGPAPGAGAGGSGAGRGDGAGEGAGAGAEATAAIVSGQTGKPEEIGGERAGGDMRKLSPCVPCGKKTLGLAGLLKGMTYGPAPSELKDARLKICAACEAADSAGARLYRTVGGRFYCGAPRLSDVRRIWRDESRDGCGCELSFKASRLEAECPLGRWAAAADAAGAAAAHAAAPDATRRYGSGPGNASAASHGARAGRAAEPEAEAGAATGPAAEKNAAPRPGAEPNLEPATGPEDVAESAAGSDREEAAATEPAAGSVEAAGDGRAEARGPDRPAAAIELVRLDANGIGDLCVAACAVAGIKRARPGARVAFAVRRHLLEWARLFSDADELLDAGSLGGPHQAQRAFDRVHAVNAVKSDPAWRSERWHELCGELCGAAPAHPRIEIPAADAKWAAETLASLRWIRAAAGASHALASRRGRGPESGCAPGEPSAEGSAPGKGCAEGAAGGTGDLGTRAANAEGSSRMPADRHPSPRPPTERTAAADSQGKTRSGSGGGKYVAVLAPYSAYGVRNWPLHRWVELEDALLASGFATAILDAPGDGRRTAMFRGARYWGQKPGRVAAIVGGADIVAGNDSGICHLAGVLGVPAVAVCGPTDGEAIFGWYGCVRNIQAPADCSPCYWLAARGYKRACVHGCDALWAIRPESVLAAAVAVASRAGQTAIRNRGRKDAAAA